MEMAERPGSITNGRVFYGLKYDLDRLFCRTRFDGRDIPDLQNANGPDASGQLSIADYVSVLRFDYSPL